ncbi:chemoreceptor glutamine deamidase CheD [Halioxenophilus sp. WMMB6]|uniref:chemoreceptor glutamine deamidase CheD n=1 Tax=Halioxenophilus sp. WMMB6 TaxID=3073815 RepID=UPI00295EDA14|nr:chemoreceptor glutamine deamidase CheD [Halioxenophilus sp. WMMB6]
MHVSDEKDLGRKSLFDNKPLHGAEATLSGFEHVNRYWDRAASVVVAKILPGEFYVTRNPEVIATTLGSCVSACLWDEVNGIGGMNHFMLPLTDVEASKVTWGNIVSDATRYGNYAMEHLINEMLKNGAARRNLRAKVFGGGKVLNQRNDVGRKNADFVLLYLHQEQIELVAQDLGDVYPRKVLFDPLTGKARVKKIRSMHNDTIINRERDYQQSIGTKPVEGDIELF